MRTGAPIGILRVSIREKLTYQLPRRTASSWFQALVLIFACTGAYAGTTITLQSDKTSITYGDAFHLRARIVTDAIGCDAPVSFPLIVHTLHDGAMPPVGGAGMTRGCANGAFTLDVDTNDYDVLFGAHVITMTVWTWDSAGATRELAESNPVSVVVNPQSTGSTSAGVLKAAIINPQAYQPLWQCTSASVQVQSATSISPPAGAIFAPGVVEYAATGCSYDCRPGICPSPPPVPAEQQLIVEMPQRIPPGARFWVYPTGTATAGAWQPIDARVQGATATLFVKSGGETSLSGLVAVSFDGLTSGVQDMWWAGPEENGWGLSIAQNGDNLFIGLYIYRDDGTPEWLVTSTGVWNSPSRSFIGFLYEPSGAWFGDYHTADFKIGDSVGNLRITLTSDSTATLDYTIRGASGTKSIRRLPFGSTSTPPQQGAHAGLWWASYARTGWGLAIGHQGDTLFSVWYTYAKDGTTSWYVMPGGSWTSSDTYTGALYRTNGKSWLSGPYDPAAFKVTSVGRMTLHFTNPSTASMSYDVDGVTGTEQIYLQPF